MAWHYQIVYKDRHGNLFTYISKQDYATLPIAAMALALKKPYATGFVKKLKGRIIKAEVISREEG